MWKNTHVNLHVISMIRCRRLNKHRVWPVQRPGTAISSHVTHCSSIKCLPSFIVIGNPPLTTTCALIRLLSMSAKRAKIDFFRKTKPTFCMNELDDDFEAPRAAEWVVPF